MKYLCVWMLDCVNQRVRNLLHLIIFPITTDISYCFLFKSAPEIQMKSHCTILSDMFSLGMVICTIFNNGRPLIQSNNSTSAYLKQLELLDDAVHNMLPRIPIPLQEATSRLVSKIPGPRPTAQLLQLIKFFTWVAFSSSVVRINGLIYLIFFLSFVSTVIPQYMLYNF